MDRTAMLLPRPAGRTFARKLGAGAFLFFLIKGLAWLLVPLAAALLW